MVEEIFKDIPGFDGLYLVSNMGHVFSMRSQRNLKPGKVHKGYLVVHLCVNGEVHPRRVNRLVLEAFTGLCPEGKQAAHLNGMNQDNRRENLAWVTQRENEQHKRLHGTRNDTHCRRGHPLSGENLRMEKTVEKKGTKGTIYIFRRCKACTRIREAQRPWRAR